MANKKKIATAAVATTLAASLLLGGTFAWQSISQTALNEKEAVINPGGRLHNDQNWVSDKSNDTNIYVENFTDPDEGGNDIYARVRLEEYMEIVMNYGTDAAVVDVIAGSKTAKADSSYADTDATSKDAFDYTYDIHYFEKDESGESKNAAETWWTWTTGSTDSEAVYYMPTFNKNKDSLLADLNGVFDETVGGFSNSVGTDKYDYEAVTADSSKTAYAVYDVDSDTTDGVGRTDLEDLIANGTGAANYASLSDKVSVVSEGHKAAKVGTTNGLISMEDWLALNDGTYSAGTHSNYWVYDTDGWVYWSSPIEAGTATGLLLDGISLNQVMDDTYYYAINVVAQFITADDLGKDDNTGFYADGETVSEDALDLLSKIGVKVPTTTAGGEEDGNDKNDTPVVSGKIDATGMSAEELKAAVMTVLEANVTDLSITLNSDADKTMTTAIFEGITQAQGVEDGSVNLTLNGITTIAEEAFVVFAVDPMNPMDNKSVYMTQVSALTLTDVTTIEDTAFNRCSNLTSLTAPKLETVGKSAFVGHALSVIDLPELTSVGFSAFESGNATITRINLPSVTHIKPWAFSLCEYADDAEIILTGLQEDFKYDDYYSQSTYPNFLSADYTANVNLKLSSAVSDQVEGNVWTVPSESGSSTTYTFKSITLVDPDSAE